MDHEDLDMPADVDCERALLGALLLANDGPDTAIVFERLKPSDIWDPWYRWLFKEFSRVYQMGRWADVRWRAATLIRRNRKRRRGIASELAHLWLNPGSAEPRECDPKKIRSYARRVWQLSGGRTAIIRAQLELEGTVQKWRRVAKEPVT